MFLLEYLKIHITAIDAGISIPMVTNRLFYAVTDVPAMDFLFLLSHMSKFRARHFLLKAYVVLESF
ncbi:MAG: hypothetical protein A2277_16005 [Desulfobacterales bacterium RIFOXYA12_FULL_46_15]|nr:MAG: hypothetical protein A2097_06890 [Desulfobacula sp. GWF2_41_7]OGR26477.1 MAG: hypothetical protein A2277_16005 [Desulfobacterales bacterium RIFOXYA12_FULL_46_15]